MDDMQVKCFSNKPDSIKSVVENCEPVIILNSHPIQYFAPLYRFLAANGLEVEVVYFSGEPETGQFDKEFGQHIKWDIPLLEGYQYHFVKNYGSAATGSKGFRSRLNPGIIRLLSKRKKSLVIIHSWQYASDFIAVVAAKIFGHRLAFWTETNQAHELLQSRWKQIIKRIFFRVLFSQGSYFLYIGTQNRLFYEAQGINQQLLISTPYSVDNDRFQKVADTVSQAEARTQLQIPENLFVLLYSGKYIAKKNPMDLLRALTACGNANLFFVMVGEGELRREMEAYIIDNKLCNQVRLTGFVNQSEIPLYYAAADGFVMCSGIGETWGLSVNEAMSFSLPILVSTLSGCSSDLVQEGINGWTFPTGNVQQLAMLINHLANLPDTARREMGRASREIIGKHHYRQILKGFQKAVGN